MQKAQTLLKAIICDLDGTLALLGNRLPYDASTAEADLLNAPIASILQVYSQQKDKPVDLILLSGRYERYRPQTELWLKKHNIMHYKHLFLRENNDFRKDVLYKKEIYEKHIKGTYDVLFVLEDRDQVVKMWREVGVTCLQVDYGNF